MSWPLMERSWGSVSLCREGLFALMCRNADRDGGNIFASKQWYALKLRCSVRTVERGWKDLEQRGLIECNGYRYGGRGKRPVWKIVKQRLPEKPLRLVSTVLNEQKAEPQSNPENVSSFSGFSENTDTLSCSIKERELRPEYVVLFTPESRVRAQAWVDEQEGKYDEMSTVATYAESSDEETGDGQMSEDDPHAVTVPIVLYLHDERQRASGPPPPQPPAPPRRFAGHAAECPCPLCAPAEPTVQPKPPREQTRPPGHPRGCPCIPCNRERARRSALDVRDMMAERHPDLLRVYD